MSELISRFIALPKYGIGAVLILVLCVIQTEIRFGAGARTSRTNPSDHNSSLVLSASLSSQILLFALATRAAFSIHASWLLPHWFRNAIIPGLPATAWLGILLGVFGIALRLWSVFTLRERYTRTLLVLDQHSLERNGPYRWVRHPGYLGSLFCLNGIALASGNWITLLASLLANCAAYAYRIKVEDEMLVATFGSRYSEYRQQVRALLPSRHVFKRTCGTVGCVVQQLLFPISVIALLASSTASFASGASAASIVEFLGRPGVHAIMATREMPSSVIQLIVGPNQAMSDPGGPFNPTDVLDGRPRFRLIWAETDGATYIVHFEVGGFAHNYQTIAVRSNEVIWRRSTSRFPDAAALRAALAFELKHHQPD